VSQQLAPELTRPRRSEQRKANSWRARRRAARSRKPLWYRRVVVGVCSLLALLGLFVGGLVIYAHWRFSQIKKAHVVGLAARPDNAPFNVLLVGSDSRAFVDTSSQAAQFGNEAIAGGQRSDVIIIARIAPSVHQVRLLSIPRDTWVNIPGSSAVAGPNRINAAFNNGPTLLVQTIESSFHIPISDFAEVNFPGFSAMTNALGGIDLNFPYRVKDSFSGLNINHTGCQVIHGTQALALVRSRHLYYDKDGEWLADYGSDWSRIQRQDAFFRAVIAKMRGVITSPFGLNDLIGAATKNVTIDQTLSEGDLIHLARLFQGFSGSQFQTETLPTIPYTTSAGADVLLPASGPDTSLIAKFLAFGGPSASSTTTSAPTTSLSTASTTAAATSAIASGAAAGTSASDSSTVTTVATSSTPNSADIVYNNQNEPWNPTPCHA
jgi:LCP family protein required for cell wall assembly